MEKSTGSKVQSEFKPIIRTKFPGAWSAEGSSPILFDQLLSRINFGVKRPVVRNSANKFPGMSLLAYAISQPVVVVYLWQ
jgi:hypothetical protein